MARGQIIERGNRLNERDETALQHFADKVVAGWNTGPYDKRTIPADDGSWYFATPDGDLNLGVVLCIPQPGDEYPNQYYIGTIEA